MSTQGAAGATAWAHELMRLAWRGDPSRRLTEQDRTKALEAIDHAAASGALPVERASRLRVYLVEASLERLEQLRGRISKDMPVVSSVAHSGASALLQLRVALAKEPEELGTWRARLGQVVALRVGERLVAAMVRAAAAEASGAVKLELEAADGARHGASPAEVVCPEPVAVTVQLDRQRNLHLRAEVTQALYAEPAAFPHLKLFEVDAPPSPLYNCIAGSVRSESTWAWPGSRVEDFDRFYREHGFLPLDRADFSLWPGFEKVVLYAFAPESRSYEGAKAMHQRCRVSVDDGPLCVHAIVQEEDGGWLSKNGRKARLKVAHPGDLAGGDYGEPIRVYVRPRAASAA